MQRRGFLETLLGLTCGAAVGSGRIAGSAVRQHEQANAFLGSADHQGFLGAQAAGFQTFNAALAQAQRNAAVEGWTTCSVNSFLPSWMVGSDADTREKQAITAPPLLFGPRAADAKNEEVSPAELGAGHPAKVQDVHDPMDYRALELETHEDFAAKLASRGGVDGSTQEPLPVRSTVSPQEHEGRDGK